MESQPAITQPVKKSGQGLVCPPILFILVKTKPKALYMAVVKDAEHTNFYCLPFTNNFIFPTSTVKGTEDDGNKRFMKYFHWTDGKQHHSDRIFNKH